MGTSSSNDEPFSFECLGLPARRVVRIYLRKSGNPRLASAKCLKSSLRGVIYVDFFYRLWKRGHAPPVKYPPIQFVAKLARYYTKMFNFSQ